MFIVVTLNKYQTSGFGLSFFAFLSVEIALFRALLFYP
jgi:hypothetical protein